MSRKIAAITGATGFLGSHLVKAVAERGFEPRILVRRPYEHPLWRDLKPEVISGDLAAEQAIRQFVEDAAIVIHAAGLTAARSRGEFFTINRDGTRRLAEAVARYSPSARFVLVSSLAARMPALSDYAASKRAAELAAAEALDGKNPLTVVRPPAIYGPWDRGTLPFFKAAAGFIAPKLPDRNSRIALIHVEDAAAAIVQLAERNEAGGCYALADGNPAGYSWPEIHAALASAIGRRPHYMQIPGWLLKAAANAVPLLQAATKRPLIFTPGKVRELLHPDWSVDSRELPPESLDRPMYDLDRGFHATVTWLRSVGWLPQ